MEQTQNPPADTPVSQGATPAEPFKAWLCVLCGWVYDEAAGDPGSGLAPGTRWNDIPDDWLCPDCGVGKSEFVLAEI